VRKAIHILLAVIVVVLAFAFTPRANASELLPTTVGLHLVSHHFDAPAPGSPAWNNSNPGIYAKWSNGLTVGTLENSNRTNTTYVGWTFETPEVHRVSLALTAGLSTGYRQPFMVAASAAVALTDQARARVTWLPKAHAKASNALHLSAEWSF
jgi:hypothetical protein